jgi:hypothetical protein
MARVCAGTTVGPIDDMQEKTTIGDALHDGGANRMRGLGRKCYVASFAAHSKSKES